MPTRKPPELRAKFAARLRKLRLELGLSQEEFADRCGMHRTYIGSIERGERNVSIDNVARIAESLGVPPSRLLED
jgi:transcriptional regulator with XRE-family HTH domain